MEAAKRHKLADTAPMEAKLVEALPEDGAFYGPVNAGATIL
jgi:hypothetical protein